MQKNYVMHWCFVADLWKNKTKRAVTVRGSKHTLFYTCILILNLTLWCCCALSTQSLSELRWSGISLLSVAQFRWLMHETGNSSELLWLQISPLLWLEIQQKNKTKTVQPYFKMLKNLCLQICKLIVNCEP